MDYTPVTFTNSQHPHTTTYAHELALSIIFESGLQHFADRCEGFDNLPDGPKEFLRHVPAAWDDIKFISGFPGKQVILARRKADNWYMAGINGEDKNGVITPDLGFLKPGKVYRVTLISDGAYDTAFDTKYLTTDQNGKLTIKWLPRGGFAALLQEM